MAGYNRKNGAGPAPSPSGAPGAKPPAKPSTDPAKPKGKSPAGGPKGKFLLCEVDVARSSDMGTPVLRCGVVTPVCTLPAHTHDLVHLLRAPGVNDKTFTDASQSTITHAHASACTARASRNHPLVAHARLALERTSPRSLSTTSKRASGT